MHLFVLICFVGVASAQYNYGPGINNDNGLEGGNIDNSHVSAEPTAEEYNKVFYSYSAPEQEFDDLSAEQQITQAVKKNLRVIFIKSPENTALENAALQLAKVTADDHTAIYVLSKQSDIGSLANQLQKIKSQNSAKPEVHFVKYRTQADAENAQQLIQAQYDNIPGTSSNNGQDSASVLNFASKSGPSSNVNNVVNTKPPVVAKSTLPSRIPSRNSYLPPNRRYSNI